MNKILTKIFPLAFFVAVFAVAVQAQSSDTYKTENEAKKAANSGVSFKIPEGVMPMEKWEKYKGLLILVPKNPSGIFISYPDEGEALDVLQSRIEKSLARMFVHDDTKVEKIEWKTTATAAHEGDKEATAVTKTYDDETQTLQINFYKRRWNNLDFIYGYFARKSKTSKDKDDSADFLDENGKGSKPFDKFWKSFPR